MSKLYVITGFLGAGKTTFLKQMLQLFCRKTIHVIVNEFGKVGVDGELLQKMGACLDEITNGSIFCSCRLDQFEQSLMDALKNNPDVILVETSGLSDPTNIKKILQNTKGLEEICYMGTICMVDAVCFLKVYATARVVKKQLNVSDLILLNKTDLVSQEQKNEIRQLLKCHCPIVPIRETAFGKVEDAWILDMHPVERETWTDGNISADITLRKFVLHIKEDVCLETLRHIWQMIMEDVYRMKGFVTVGDEWYLIDCVGNMFHAEKWEEKSGAKNQLVILSGYGLPASTAIKKAMDWYPEVITYFE